jgi:hypothetical protein
MLKPTTNFKLQTTNLLHLSDLYLYPIKSLGGIRVERAELTDRGLRHDRRFMLVDETHRFLTQRELPELALFDLRLRADGLEVSHRTRRVTPLVVPFVWRNGESIATAVFGWPVETVAVSAEADEWFSHALGRRVRLVFQPDEAHRPVDPDYALRPTDQTSLSDGYPYLIIGQSSLDDLNAHLDDPVPMNRFRPNLVVSGSPAYDEDRWGEFLVGGLRFFAVKPCARCGIPGIDQATGQRSPEVLRALNAVRRRGTKTLFGQNLLAEATSGWLTVGDEITVLTRRGEE